MLSNCIHPTHRERERERECVCVCVRERGKEWDKKKERERERDGVIGREKIMRKRSKKNNTKKRAGKGGY